MSVLDYRDDGHTVAMTRAFTVPTFRGHGYAGEVVDRAVAQLEAQGDRQISPVCWYVADWFSAHPERAGILRGRRSAERVVAASVCVNPRAFVRAAGDAGGDERGASWLNVTCQKA